MTPLETLLNTGSIWIDGVTYVGTASDGMQVQFGDKGDEDTINKYLAIHSSPREW